MISRIEKGDEKSQRIKDAILKKLEITDNGHRIQIGWYSKQPEWAGRRLDEIASELNLDTFELVMQIERSGGASVVNHSINESDVRYVMQQPWVATASDGSAKVPTGSVPHPRNYGTFPRRIGFYANREKVISMEQAIYSSTGLPAEILGLDDRGLLIAGRIADIAVFDPAGFIDRSTFVNPHQYADGLVHLFVNGQSTILQTRATGTLSGRAIRKPAKKRKPSEKP